MDMEKFRDFVSSFQRQLGVLDSGKTITDENLLSRGSKWDNFNPEQENYIRQVMGELKRYIQEQGLQEKVKMDFTEKGFVVTVTGKVLYDLGKAVIKNKGQNLLNQIGERLIKIPNNIRVEGHTDNLPINNDSFPSNWELSTARATQVIQYFIEKLKISPARLSAAGYSKYRPRYQNDTVENRAKNRRVEIVILNSVLKEKYKGGE
jgi:chemotaxis protein MotB